MLGVIAERRRSLAERGAAGGDAEARDVLDMLLQATDDNGVPMTGKGGAAGGCGACDCCKGACARPWGRLHCVWARATTACTA